ncbi:MAG: hypothetical protein H6741_23115 [Alphaproteobacteria bacterium]|nr:hypothetical protein [Alphaproteobacteria bacterium]
MNIEEPTAGEQDAALKGDAGSTPQLPEQRGLMREFMDFIIHEKAWWMTPIVVVLLAMVAFILWAEASPVLPFIYTVF